ncbi:MAG: CPBP family glutamic-type intramembrane protease, partial [Chloroflexota bacterium]
MTTINRSGVSGFVTLLARYELLLFFSLTMALSALIGFLAYQLGDPNIAILTIFTPSITAVVLTAIVDGRRGLYDLLMSQVFRRVRLSWLFASFLLFPALAAAAILLYATMGREPLALRTTLFLPQAIVILLVALGEEFGWRGYALPKLQQLFSPLSSSLILGLLWGFWHYPGYLIGVGVPLE